MSDISGGIDLSFGPDSVKPSEFEPAPEGVYTLFLQEVEVKKTKVGELMLVLQWVIDDQEYAGRKIKDNIVIPGSERKANEPDKWNTMMNMLRDRLEAITGREWREDNMQLDPHDLSGRMVKAIVNQEPYDYTAADGTRKTGVGNSIKKYLQPGEGQAGSAAQTGGSGFSL